ncbi:hypothetical protein D3C80_1539140 [compost metagenome]
MQGGHGFVGGRQRRLHVGTFEHQRIVGSAKHQRRMKGGFIGRHIHWLWPLDQYPPWLYHPPAEPAAQRQCTRQRGFGAVPGGRQMVAMNGEDQRVTVRLQTETQIGAFGNDALVAHQALEPFGQGAARHQGVTDHVE